MDRLVQVFNYNESMLIVQTTQLQRLDTELRLGQVYCFPLCRILAELHTSMASLANQAENLIMRFSHIIETLFAHFASRLWILFLKINNRLKCSPVVYPTMELCSFEPRQNLITWPTTMSSQYIIQGSILKERHGHLWLTITTYMA